jgi:hypothetical protein
LAAAEGLKVGGGHLPGFFRVVPDGLMPAGQAFRMEA